MTIDEAINWLNDIGYKSGFECPVYFDCPHCRTSFSPGEIVTKAVHVKTAAEPPKDLHELRTR